MTEPRAGLKRGYYLLNTDGGNGAPPRGPIGPRGDWCALANAPSGHRGSDLEGDRSCHPQRGGVPSVDRGIEACARSRDPAIRVYMDSELVVDQVNGVSAVRQAHLSELHEVASSLGAQFKSFRISWVPREMNAEADQLVRMLSPPLTSRQ